MSFCPPQPIDGRLRGLFNGGCSCGCAFKHRQDMKNTIEKSTD